LFGKLFVSMFDGSLHGHWEATVTLQQLVILANRHGEVDMNAESISARTAIPLDIIKKGLSELIQPDPLSREPREQGRRIAPLSEGRSWGWRIVNYEKYRFMRDEDDRREQTRLATARWREKSKVSRGEPRLSHADADVDVDAEAKNQSQKKNRRTVRYELREAGPAQGNTAAEIGLPLPGNEQEAVLTAAYVAELKAAYPDVDVDAAIRSMRIWLHSNPRKRKKDVTRFVNNWLKGEAEDQAKRSTKGKFASRQDELYAGELREALAKREAGRGH
jgi:hypothetical protein